MKNTKAYQGIPGSFSHIATQYVFPNDELVGFHSFEEVFAAIKNNEVDQAVLPIQNTTIGSINEVYDHIYEYGYHIKGEVTLRIAHNLVSPGDKLNKITKLYSHPKALNQCTKFIKNNPNISTHKFEDTAAAAAYVSIKKAKNESAIASLLAAKLFDLKVVKKNIQDEKQNFTWFVIISKVNNNKKGEKTSIVFEAAHKPGSLVSALQPLAEANINLSYIESRPQTKKPWVFLFYLDFEHEDNPKLLAEIIKKIKPHTNFCKKIGTYYKGDTIQESYDKNGAFQIKKIN